MLHCLYDMRCTLSLAITSLLCPAVVLATIGGTGTSGAPPPSTGASPPSTMADDLVSSFGEMWGQAQHVADQMLLDTYATTATGAQSMGKVLEYGGAASRVISSLSLTGETVTEQVDSLVSALTHELANQAPPSVTIEDMEMREGSAYACGTKGIMYDMRTMEKVRTRLEDGPGGSMNVYITYTFKNLHFFFDNYVQHVPFVKTLVGKLDLMFKVNEVELLVNVPSVADLVRNAAYGQCVVHVKDFRANKLASASAKLIANSNIRRHVVENKLNDALQNNPEHLEKLKRRIEVKVLVQFQKALTSTGGWVCKDEGLINLIKDKGGSMDPPVYSEDFSTYCSNKSE